MPSPSNRSSSGSEVWTGEARAAVAASKQPCEQRDAAGETLSETIGAKLLSTATAAATAAAAAWAEADAADAEASSAEAAPQHAAGSPDDTDPAPMAPLPQERRRASTTIGARYAIRSCLAHALEEADTKEAPPEPPPAPVLPDGASSHRAHPGAYPVEEALVAPSVIEAAMQVAAVAEVTSAEAVGEVAPGNSAPAAKAKSPRPSVHPHTSSVNAARRSIRGSLKGVGAAPRVECWRQGTRGGGQLESGAAIIV